MMMPAQERATSMHACMHACARTRLLAPAAAGAAEVDDAGLVHQAVQQAVLHELHDILRVRLAHLLQTQSSNLLLKPVLLAIFLYTLEATTSTTPNAAQVCLHNQPPCLLRGQQTQF
jgi:hypothetical protein